MHGLEETPKKQGQQGLVSTMRKQPAAAPGEMKLPHSSGGPMPCDSKSRFLRTRCKSRLLWDLFFFWSLKQHIDQIIHYQPEARNLKPNLTLLMQTRCQYFGHKSKVLLWSTVFGGQVQSPDIYLRDEIWSFQTGQRITGKGECGEERGK